jgi:ankyrin repeat protein
MITTYLSSMQAGAKPSLHNTAGLSTMLAAAGHGQAACLQLLLRHAGEQTFCKLAAATDSHGRSALHFAAASGALA